MDRSTPPAPELAELAELVEPFATTPKRAAPEPSRSQPATPLTERQSAPRRTLEPGMQSVLDRTLGTLAPVEGDALAAAPGAKTLAEEIAEMLRSPDGVRKAIMLGEILQRPEHRW